MPSLHTGQSLGMGLPLVAKEGGPFSWDSHAGSPGILVAPPPQDVCIHQGTPDGR